MAAAAAVRIAPQLNDDKALFSMDGQSRAVTQYIMQHPNQRDVLTNRVDQALAELSLSRLDHQWPVQAIILEGNSTQTRPAQERGSLGYAVTRKINNLIRNLTKERVFPSLTLKSGVLPKKSPSISTEVGDSVDFVPTETTKDLGSMNISPGLSNNILNITKQISSGTAQGTVYSVRIKPNKSYHYVSIDVHDVRVNQTRQVEAVLKKSPIYDPGVWKRYIALNILQELKKQYISLSARDQAIQKYTYERQAGQIVNAANFVLQSHWTSIPYDEMAATIETRYLNKAFYSINTAAYIDALVTYIGSKLVENNLSPAFPLLYGTFRVLDSNFFDAATESILGKEVQNIPMQVIIEEKLSGGLKDLLTSSGWLFVDSLNAVKQIQRRQSATFNIRHLVSVFAQIVFGLFSAQKIFNFVHNDLHWQNIMYEEVPATHAIYYKSEDNSIYKIPTYGKLLKFIDFGRSRINVDNLELFSAETLEVDPRWSVDSFNNDLLRITSVILLHVLPGGYEISAISPVEEVMRTQMNKFLDHVIQCGPSWKKQSIFEDVDMCVKNKYGKQSDQACWREEFSVGPFTRESTCNNAIPAENIHFFEFLKVNPRDVPADAIIYPL